jgi:hypothetical protein
MVSVDAVCATVTSVQVCVTGPPTAVTHTFVVPLATAVTRPVWSTVAVAGVALVQLNFTPGTTTLAEFRAVAVICSVEPIAVIVGVAGVTAKVAPRTPR